MRIEFLGTGTSQGIPLIGCDCDVCVSTDSRDKRLRSSVWVQMEGLSIVIDAGPDFRQQMLRAKIRHIDAILLTHEHKDHIAGLDDVRAYNRLTGNAVPIYCNERVANTVKRDFSYAFSKDRYPGIPHFDIHNIKGYHRFYIQGQSIQPVKLMHHKLPVMGFRIGDFAYLTDLNKIPEIEFEKLHNLSVLVIDALRNEKHISHFSLNEALECIRIIKPERAYLTHMSHGLDKHEELLRKLPQNVFPAYDGLVINCNM